MRKRNHNDAAYKRPHLSHNSSEFNDLTRDYFQQCELTPNSNLTTSSFIEMKSLVLFLVASAALVAAQVPERCSKLVNRYESSLAIAL
jgi:hypothetical protein